MNNGSPDANGQELSRFYQGPYIMSPEEHARSMAQVDQVIALAQQKKAENDAALQRYMQEQQLLEEMRETQRKLHELRSGAITPIRDGVPAPQRPPPNSTPAMPQTATLYNHQNYSYPASLHPIDPAYTQQPQVQSAQYPTFHSWNTGSVVQPTPGPSSNPHPQYTQTGASYGQFQAHPSLPNSPRTRLTHNTEHPLQSSTRAGFAPGAPTQAQPTAASVPMTRTTSQEASRQSNQSAQPRADRRPPSTSHTPAAVPQASTTNLPQAGEYAATEARYNATRLAIVHEMVTVLKDIDKDKITMIMQQTAKLLFPLLNVSMSTVIADLPPSLDQDSKRYIIIISETLTDKLKVLPRQHIFAAFREIQTTFNLARPRTSNATSMPGGSSSMRTQQPPITTSKTEMPQEASAGPPPNPNSGSGSGSSTATTQGNVAVGLMSQASIPRREGPKLPTFLTPAQEPTSSSIPTPLAFQEGPSTIAAESTHNAEADNEVQEITIQEYFKSEPDQELRPSKANKKRLAHDIMRALGRPAHRPTPSESGSQDLSQQQDGEDGSGKRKRDEDQSMEVDSPGSADKRPRTDSVPEAAVEMEPPAAELQQAQVIDNSSSPHPYPPDSPAIAVVPPLTQRQTDAEVYDEIKTPGALLMEHEEQVAKQQQVHEDLQFPEYRSPQPPPFTTAQPMYWNQPVEADTAMVTNAPSSPPEDSSVSAPPVSASEGSDHEGEQRDDAGKATPGVVQRHDAVSVPPIAVLDDMILPNAPQVVERNRGESSQKARSFVEVPTSSASAHAERDRSKLMSDQVKQEDLPSVARRVGNAVEVTPQVQDQSEAGPSTSGKAPLFLPSPTSSAVEEEGEEAIGPGFVLNSNLLRDDGGPSVRPVRNEVRDLVEGKGKGKQRAVKYEMDESSDDEIQFLGMSPARKSVTSATIRRKDGPKMVERFAYVLLPGHSSRKPTSNLRTYNRTMVKRIVSPSTEGEEGEGIDELEQQKAEENARFAMSRLCIMKCKWKGCEVVLDSTNRLLAHVSIHASDCAKSKQLWCEWINCAHRYIDFPSLSSHIASHATSSLYCAKDGCTFRARDKRWLTAHHADPKVHRKDSWKPTSEPGPLEPPNDLQPLPVKVPAYLGTARKISKHRMSRAMHIRLGAKVAANIVCYVQPSGRSYVSRPIRSSQKVMKRIAAIEQEMIEHPEEARSRIFRMAHDEYEAWSDEQYRSRPKYCDDIPSGQVTEMVQEGLVLLGNPAEDVAEGPEEPVEREEDEEVGEPVTWPNSTASEDPEGKVGVSNEEIEDHRDGIDSAGVRKGGEFWELVDAGGHSGQDGVPVVAEGEGDGWTADQDDERGQGGPVSRGQSSGGPTDDEGVVENLLWANNRRNESGSGLFRRHAGLP